MLSLVNDIYVQAAAVVAVGGIVVGVVKKFVKNDPKAAHAIENAIVHDVPHGLLTIGEDAVKAIEHLISSPVGATLVAKGKLDLHKALNHLQDATAISEAKTILQNVGKAYSALSDSEKAQVQSLLKLAVQKVLGISATDKQIQGWFTAVDQASTDLSANSVYQAMFGTAPASEPAPAVATDTQQNS